MQKRYSEMTMEELKQEIARLQEERKTASFPSHAEILEQKYYLAKAYMLKPEEFTPGTYTVIGHSGLFHLDYVNGIMAWGVMGEEEEEASFPISMLRSNNRIRIRKRH